MTGLLAQGLARLHSLVEDVLGRVCFQFHSDHWLNLGPWGCRIEDPISLLAVSQEFLSS